eukprot:CAMPEP_0185727440 /NCGR_PEP_ID=MMETSP1171-20130828/3129_1 /TAXON_ID=374046 /ORGANISM="Helicotheca tamensis, Strain CCMP826" /LENGTH=72 /DNA_ID=CAMNT_0028396015 /DNA_START=327 /DNA_END=545 /DNA_ORIENTATION=+
MVSTRNEKMKDAVNNINDPSPNDPSLNDPFLKGTTLGGRVRRTQVVRRFPKISYVKNKTRERNNAPTCCGNV